MLSRARERARLRTEFLFERLLDAEELHRAKERVNEVAQDIPSGWIQQRMFFAGLSVSPLLFCGLSVLCGAFLGYLLSFVLSLYVLPLFVAAGMWLPWSLTESRAQKRAAAFAGDYPTVLLATASSIKIGLTPFLALERSIRLLPKESLMRLEVEKLLALLRQGESKEFALGRFAADITLPDLPLFRSAFLLVMENGGKFAPTLHRLATVSKDRAVLISSARVSTATMRMTANILLFIAPVLVMILAARMDNYWTLFREHPVANAVASTGIVIISMSYLMLRRMSAFKP